MHNNFSNTSECNALNYQLFKLETDFYILGLKIPKWDNKERTNKISCKNYAAKILLFQFCQAIIII